MNKLVILSIVFALSEAGLVLVKHSRKDLFRMREDRFSAIILWLAITAGFASGFIFSKPAGDIGMITGFGFIIAGLIIRWIAIVQLGESFTVDVAVKNDAILKTDGIYGKVRHPSYLGILLIVLGFSVTMHSLMSWITFELPVLLAILYRIYVEERVLVNEFGDNYLKYRSTSKQLIPYVF